MITGNENDQQKPKRRPNWREISEKAEHGRSLRENDRSMYEEWLRSVKTMHGGGDCGQIEPWSPWSLRDTYYDGWADRDFGTLLSQLGEAEPIRPPTLTEEKE